MAEPFLGQVIIFAGTYAPQGWAMCNGQLLSIAQNTALYALLGTTYGGDGRTTFAVPDLRGRLPVGTGTGAGLPPVNIGQSGGSTQVTLTTNNLPAHTHTLQANSGFGTQGSPTAGAIAQINVGTSREPVAAPAFSPSAPNTNMASGSIGPTGGSQPVNTQPPYLGMNYIIALQGIFPPRP